MNPIKAIVTGAAVSFAVAATQISSASQPAVIPLPQKMDLQPGEFTLSPGTRIVTDAAARETGQWLADQLRPATGYGFKVTRQTGDGPGPGAILLTTNGASAALGAEGYELRVASNSVVIRAPHTAGLFYGTQTLRQLLPPEIFSSTPVPGANWTVPCVQIEDQPRFPWRGLMLDASRHFFSKPEVERLLDEMALHKLNTFHWHLADDQGWRIEIKKYPDLTRIGAWRPGIGFGLDPKAGTAWNRRGEYGGYYTQADIREVVRYATARHITIVPEIEMPGHSSAALAACPQFSCTGGPFAPPLTGGVFNGIYDPAKPETFRFLADVLTEVFALFPGQFIHVGGDEVPKDTWQHSPDCQALMKQEGLKNEEELQSWFIRRMEKFITAHGRTLVGWSEILQGGLAQNAMVMDWIGGGAEAARAGHNAIMTPTGFCYFDYYQSTNRLAEPRAGGGFLPLEKVYAFEPVPSGLEPEWQSHILGVQGNLWSEYVPNFRQAEYMIFPRACALAEVGWSSKTERNWLDFSRRLEIHEKRLAEWRVNFRRNPPAP